MFNLLSGTNTKVLVGVASGLVLGAAGVTAVPMVTLSKTNQDLYCIEISCPNSTTGNGLGLTDLRTLKSYNKDFLSNILELQFTSQNKNAKKSESIETHYIVEEAFDKVKKLQNDAIKIISNAEGKLVVNSLDNDPSYKDVNWKSIFYNK